MSQLSLQQYYDTQRDYWQSELDKYAQYNCKTSKQNSTRCKTMLESLQYFARSFNLDVED